MDYPGLKNKVLSYYQYSAHPFPFNMKELRGYLKKTGKTMKDLTVNEFDMFRVSPIAKAN